MTSRLSCRGLTNNTRTGSRPLRQTSSAPPPIVILDGHSKEPVNHDGHQTARQQSLRLSRNEMRGVQIRTWPGDHALERLPLRTPYPEIVDTVQWPLEAACAQTFTNSDPGRGRNRSRWASEVRDTRILIMSFSMYPPKAGRPRTTAIATSLLAATDMTCSCGSFLAGSSPFLPGRARERALETLEQH